MGVETTADVKNKPHELHDMHRTQSTTPSRKDHKAIKSAIISAQKLAEENVVMANMRATPKDAPINAVQQSGGTNANSNVSFKPSAVSNEDRTGLTVGNITTTNSIHDELGYVHDLTRETPLKAGQRLGGDFPAMMKP